MEFLSEYAATRKYSKFQWRFEWVQYASTITDTDTKCLFFRSIIDYGLMCEQPKELSGAQLVYFRSVVVPDLDKQHRCADKSSKKKQK